MRRHLTSVVALAFVFSTGLSVAAATTVFAAANCSITSLSTPAKSGSYVKSTGRADCGTTVFHLSVEVQLQRYAGTGWIASDDQTNTCASCSTESTTAQKYCTYSTSMLYRSAIRIRWPDTGYSWGAWQYSPQVNLNCY